MVSTSNFGVARTFLCHQGLGEHHQSKYTDGKTGKRSLKQLDYENIGISALFGTSWLQHDE